MRGLGPQPFFYPMFSRRQREGVGLVVALAVHAAAFAVAGRRAEGPDESEHAAPLEVEIETPPAEPPPEPQAPEAPTTEQAVAPAPAARVVTATPGAREHGAETAPVEAEPAPSSSAFTFNPAAPGAAPGFSDESLGLAGRNRFMGTDQVALTAAERGDGPQAVGPRNVAPGVDQSIRDALDAHDHELGFDVGGPILAIAEELTRPSDTPMNGRAIFEVVIDADGNVGDVRLLDAGDGRASWESLGTQLGATLRARRIAWRLKKGHGVAVRIEVNSRFSMPSGARAGQAVSNPFVNTGPETGVELGGHFDFSDIGAKPSRDVHARILNEKRF